MASLTIPIPIFETEMAVKLAGGKIHVYKKWMNRRCYHRRVEKKWVRRYGPVLHVPTCYMAKHPFGSGHVLFVHPALMPELRKATARA